MWNKTGLETNRNRPVASAGNASFTRGDWVVHLGIIVSFAAALAYPLITGLLPASGVSSAISHDCLLKSVTGIPCPTCGFTRSCHVLMQGNLLDCLKYNPFSLAYISGLGILCVLSLRAIRQRKPFELSRPVSAAVFVILGLAWLLKLLGPREFW